ncbi:MAG: DNA cytosine methyltransferase [Candidatus Heimdallarchaeota archaeon]
MIKNDNNNDYTHKAIDLFAGIGGIRLGFMKAFGDKINFVFSNEIDKYCCQTYEANFGDNPLGDITQIDPEEIPDFDILLAGFPCQAFSIAGRKDGFDDTRGTLFYNIAQILYTKKPAAFLLENVPHLLNHDNGRTFQVIKDILEEDLNYNIHYKILNAKNFGLPQNRARIFIVGFKENLKFNFPPPLEIKVVIEKILEKKVDESYYLSQQYLDGLKKHRARHEAKGNGFGYMVLSKNGIANTIVLGGMGKERNLIKDKILPNSWKKDGDDIQLRNNEGIRKMTEREWARLQGFPEEFKFPVAKTRIYRQLANSVPIPVISAIAKEMRKSLTENIIEKKPQLNKIERRAIDLLLTMYKRNKFSQSGKKSKNALITIINNYALRIDNLNEILSILYKMKLIDKYNKDQIFFNKKLLNIDSELEFRRQITNIFFDKTTSPTTMEEFITT